MSLAVEVWRWVERYNPAQLRGADGRWGGGMRGWDGVARLEDDGDGIDLGFGNPEFRGGDERGEDVNGHTARLDPAGMRKLHADLSAAVAEGSRRQKAVDAYYDEHDEMPNDYETWKTSGYVSGDGADVHYEFELDDPSVGVTLTIASIPHSSDDTISDAHDAGTAAHFDAAETRRLLRMLRSPVQATESTALELWRALEARHNLRGPNGRFIKAGGGGGGGGSDRPSLADAVRGTAAGGPKRQRADKGGMSVADAVRSAAKKSDSTGRPTQRTPAQHRAEGAHSVADEVDRALADHGVPEAQSKEIAARARAAADAHGERAKPRRAPSAKLEDQATYDLEGWLHHFGTEHRNSGAVMRELDRRKARDSKGPAPTPAPPPAPEADVPHPKPPPPPPAPAPVPAPKASAPKSASKPRRGSRLDGGQLAEVEGQLNSATSMDQAREHLAGLNGPQLRQVADFAQVYVTSGDPKEILIGRILNATTRRRLGDAAS